MIACEVTPARLERLPSQRVLLSRCCTPSLPHRELKTTNQQRAILAFAGKTLQTQASVQYYTPRGAALYRRSAHRCAAMAGLIMLGCPILAGVLGGAVLQVAMRKAELSLFERIAVELALVGFGAIVLYLFPPGSAVRGENWGWFLLCASMVSTGGFAMAEGLIVNIVPGGAATALKVLGVLLVMLCAKCWHMKQEVRRRDAETNRQSERSREMRRVARREAAVAQATGGGAAADAADHI